MLYAKIPNKEKHWQPHLETYFNSYLRRCIKGSAADMGESANNYRAFLSFATPSTRPTGHRDVNFANVCWDTPCGIVLAHQYLINDKKEYRGLACVGFTIEKSIIHIRQIQGARYRQEELLPLRWEKLLVKVVIEIARQLGFKTVEILPAEKNEWRDLISYSQLKLRYDVTAKRMGFKWNPQKRVYEFAL
ncbi:hypothetical protein HY798_04695 [Candidatus Falkowbacteria bacterium]|nr:hypothetical protein [Candidatus Falkowbacteria bacterium]